MKVIILSSQSGDWEGLFIDNKVVYQGHSIGRTDLLEYSEKYNFKSSDIKYLEVNDVDEQYLYNCGIFPNRIEELNGKYE